MNLKIISTSDGSNSLFHAPLNETYHSVHGAIQESLHVFIQNGLACVMRNGQGEISILEVGFGTGLNALLTLQYAQQESRKVRYTAIEPYPVPEDIWSKLNYPVLLSDDEVYRSLHLSDWSITVPLSPFFELLKLRTMLQDATLEQGSFDLVYYDAFAPSKQPELWEMQVLTKVADAMKPGGVLVTYCAKGQVKRDLRNLGLSIETLAGPPGKKEMVRSFKI